MFKVGDIVEHVDGHTIGMVEDIKEIAVCFKVIQTIDEWNNKVQLWKDTDLKMYEYGVGDVVEWEGNKWKVSGAEWKGTNWKNGEVVEMGIFLDLKGLLCDTGIEWVDAGDVTLIQSARWIATHLDYQQDIKNNLGSRNPVKKSAKNAGRIVEIKHMSINAIKKEYMVNQGKNKVTIARGLHPDYIGVDEVKINKDDILTLTYL